MGRSLSGQHLAGLQGSEPGQPLHRQGRAVVGCTCLHEYAPLRFQDAEESERIYRKISYGKLLDVYVLDMRCYRGPNTANLQSQASAETAFLGETQVAWLKDELKHSDATWKVSSADMPIGLNIGDGVDAQGKARWEAVANGNNGPAAGRELPVELHQA
jgi:alkaline phosphatase D